MAPTRAEKDESSIIFDYLSLSKEKPKFLDGSNKLVTQSWIAPPAYDAPKPKINVYQVADVKLVDSFNNSDSQGYQKSFDKNFGISKSQHCP